MRLRDYNGGVPLGHCTFGLSWDITDGKNIDLDASAIMLDGNLEPVDLIFFSHLTSKCGSIRHGGDEQEGDAKGDDEKIHIDFARVPPHVRAIGFNINSYSGEELDDVSKTTCGRASSLSPTRPPPPRVREGGGGTDSPTTLHRARAHALTSPPPPSPSAARAHARLPPPLTPRARHRRRLTGPTQLPAHRRGCACSPTPSSRGATSSTRRRSASS